jgi:hypothetical protein
LNSVELVCRTPTSSETTGTVVWSHKGHWGTWSNGGFCPAGKFLTTASLKSMGDVGDDTFGQAAGFTCSDGTTVLRGTNEVPHDKMGGEWEHASCPVDTAICGISVDMRPNLGKGGDDTAMSGMRLRCCALPK